MTEHTIRRIVFACDAASDIQGAVEGAAALASRWRAALHGVFLQDENLYRLASLPFGRQVTLSSAVTEDFNVDELEKITSTLESAMRRTLADAAAKRGLEWSFGVVRDFPTAAALTDIEGDILVVQGTTRPFSGAWRLRSPWESLPEDYGRAILIRREHGSLAGPVVLLLGNGNDTERILRVSFAMTEPDDAVVILVREEESSRLERVRQITESLESAHRRKVRLEASPTEPARVLHRIERLKPSLLIIDSGGLERRNVHELITGSHCDVFLVR
ncbi:MAG TPA: hypothetical protein VEJ16_05305 [Alphaproteobacteria bacterium]|nr:hypothetical protein [Alphaproteobacteria bacterium]